MKLLAGERFHVRSHTAAAAYAGWLLQHLGATVDHATVLDPEGLGAFLCRGAAFTPEPRLEILDGGVLITDAPVGGATRRTLTRLSHAARVIWITPWGLDNDWSERPASDLVLQAAGGWMASTGDPDREPLGPPGAQCRFVGGLCAVVAALSRFAHPGAPPEAPGLTDVPLIEAVAATTIYDSVAFQYYGRLRGRSGNRYSHAQPTIVTLPCKDGYIGIHASLHSQWVRLAALVGHPELVDDPRFASPMQRSRNVAALDEYLLPWLAERTRIDAYHELQANRIPASSHPDVAEVLNSPHLKARNAWESVTTLAGRRLQVPGAPVRVIASNGAASRQREPALPWQDGRLRVVDLSMGWAGPLVSHILAGFGADVIKVEGHNRFDWWRGSRPPGDDPTLALHERSHVFNPVNRGKRGITLNLATRRGAELARRLITTADVVVENFRAGVIENLGLGFETLSAANPGLLMLRQPGFGSDGPDAGYLAFGNTIEGMSGLTSLIGFRDGPPVMMSNAFGNPVSGLIGAAAALAALAAGARDGRGRLIECAQLEGFLPLVSEDLIEFQTTGQIPARRGNARPGSTPSGVFACRGDDCWVALEVEDDAQWARLAHAIGEAWARDAGLAHAEARAARQDALTAKITAWTMARTREDVVAACTRAGVPAAPVCNEADLLSFEPLAAGGFWVGEERAVVGFHMYPSLPMRRSGMRPQHVRPAPLLGQHTNEVLEGIGVAESEWPALLAEGVIGSAPGA